MATTEPRKIFKLLARLGYGARGLVYLIVGALALLAAFDRGGDTTDSKGALATLLAQPFGEALLAVVAVGLVGFALWRLAQSLADADSLGAAPKALMRRAGYAIAAVIYGGLAVFAVRLALGESGGAGGEKEAHYWTAELLAQPFGQVLVTVLGLGILVFGLGMAVRGWKRRFMRRLKPPPERRWVERLGRIGFMARGTVFGIVGLFLVIAAWHASPGEAKGIAGALAALREQPYGWVLLAVVAAGLAAFGAFGLVQAVYRRVAPPRVPPPEHIVHAAERKLRGRIGQW